jgi:hypothetical protein
MYYTFLVYKGKATNGRIQFSITIYEIVSISYLCALNIGSDIGYYHCLLAYLLTLYQLPLEKM